ncbi:hypothetical protein OG539_32440 [Actinacidiphila glaucinigra]|uniref:hypothetical protein n=1 Tax=Actinacidiphila glaucinigra TaxID=235986 RepID=UPI0032514620
MTDGDAAVWHFTRRDGFWKPTRTPPADANLLWAVETLAISFGRRAYGVREFLEEVERVVSGDTPGPSVNTTTAFVRKRPDGAFELCDKYGQFVNTVLTARELTSILATLAATIEAG